MASIAARMAPGANLIILRVVHPFISTDLTAIADALEWVYQNRDAYNIVAVNMSIGDGGNYQTEQSGDDNEWSDAISAKLAQLDAQNVICVAAAGNSYREYHTQVEPDPLIGVPGIGYPAADPAVISVGAVWDYDVGAQGAFTPWYDNETEADWITAFTQRYEDLLDVLAPGGVINAAWESVGTADGSGTSQAAPHVTAAVALAQHIKQDLQGGGRLTRGELVDLFQETGVEIEDVTRSTNNVMETGLSWQRLDVQTMAFKLFKPTLPDLVATSDWGFSETDNKTFDTTPTITGSGPEGSHVWIYDGSSSIDDFQLASGVSSFERTLGTLGTGTHNITVRVAANGSVSEANRSVASNTVPLSISASDSITLTSAEEPFSARLSEFTGGQALIVSGENVSGTSTLGINWGSSPLRTLAKTDSGTLIVDDVTDRTKTVTYLSNVGKSVFTTDTGVSGTGQDPRVANWTIEANADVEFTTTQNLAALAVGAAGFVTMTETDPQDYNVLYTGGLGFTETGGHATGTLDISNNAMVIDFATVAQAHNNAGNVRGWIIEGRGGMGFGNGAWDGTGITSSTAQAWNATAPEQRAVGYAVNADLPLGAETTFVGESVDSSCIFVRYTVSCDANLDGTVNDNDVTIFGSFYNPTTADANWSHGDADYDGYVDDDDVTALGVLYGESLET